MPDPAQEIAVGGSLPERIKRRLWLFTIRVLRFPYRVLTLPLRQLRGEVMSLRSAAVESLAYVGIELRRLSDLVEQGAAKAAPADAGAMGGTTSIVEVPFASRSLAGVDPPGPVLVVGSRGREAAFSLTSLGYDVTHVEGPVAEWDSADRRYRAVLYMNEGARPDPTDLERIGELLPDDGVLVLGVAFGFGANGSPAFDEGSLDDLLTGWAVTERMVVANSSGRAWSPVRNGGTPERGVALVAAKRTTS